MIAVREIMSRDVVCVPTDMHVKDLAELFVRRQISGAPVTDASGKAVGVVSLRDLACYLARVCRCDEATEDYYAPDRDLGDYIARFFPLEDGHPEAVALDLMNPAVYSVEEGASVQEVARLMRQARVHRVLVTRGREVVGILSSLDLVRVLEEVLESTPGAAR
jgi:CBS domain-containing protein